MGMRFRKSFGGKGFRVNVSKSGIGFSAGTKGFRVAKKAGGGMRTTASIPGTGLSYTKDYSSKSGCSAKGAESVTNKTVSPGALLTWRILFLVFGILLVALGAMLALVMPLEGLASVAFGFIILLVSRSYKKKYKAYKAAVEVE